MSENQKQSGLLQENNELVQNEPSGSKKLQALVLVLTVLIIAIIMLVKLLTGGSEGKAKDDKKHIETAMVDKREFNFSEALTDIEKSTKPVEQSAKVNNANDELLNILKGDNSNKIFTSPKPRILKSSSLDFFVKTTGNDSSTGPSETVEDDPDRKELSRTSAEIKVKAHASKLASDLRFILEKGTFIHCSLNTRIVSELAGNVLCTTTENIYSADGSVLLIDKGSKIFGTFDSGKISDGVSRLFVTWHEIRTPDHIVIPVSSPSTGALGASGMAGYIDHQYLKRFGSAILLSIIDDASSALANEISRHGDDNARNTRDRAKDMATTALDEFIKIKPVFYKNQGDIVSVYVNKDIDFSSVYELEIEASLDEF